MVTKVLISCEVCGKEFERNKSEVNRNKRLGRRVYCSLKCCGADNADNIPLDKRGDTSHLICNNRLDEFSPFRIVWSSAKRHAKEKNREFNLTLPQLKQLWENQNGICPYTGWNMELPRTCKGSPRSHRKASIDRKDSSKGYIVENVQFVSYMANCAKNCFTEFELFEFCNAVTEHYCKNHVESLT